MYKVVPLYKHQKIILIQEFNMAVDYSRGRLGSIPAKLDDTKDYKSKYSPPPNENSQTDESVGSLGIGKRNFGGSIYQQSASWDINNGSTGPRGTTGAYGRLGSIGTPGFNERQPINGENNPGPSTPLKGIVKSPVPISPVTPIDGSSSDYSKLDSPENYLTTSTQAQENRLNERIPREGTESINQHSNPLVPQNNEAYQIGGDTSNIHSPEDMTPSQYVSFLFSRDSINHNPYKGKQ